MSNYAKKFEISGVDKVRSNLQRGLYSTPRERAAREWLYQITGNEIIETQPIIIEKTVHNNFFIFAGKSKIVKWFLSKLGKSHLIEHDG